MNIKMMKIEKIMQRIYELADNDLLVTDAKTGLNDFTMNEHYVQKLENLSKKVYKLGDEISKKAASLQEKIDAAVDQKQSMQDVSFIEEVTDWSEKCDEAQRQNKIVRFKRSNELRIKREILDSSDEEPNDQNDFAGDYDGHFNYSKANKNDPEAHSFTCDVCSKVFRDYNNLRNHDTHHKMEFYRCMMCLKVFRSL